MKKPSKLTLLGLKLFRDREQKQKLPYFNIKIEGHSFY